MPEKLLRLSLILFIALFITGNASAGWFDDVKDATADAARAIGKTAVELTKKVGKALTDTGSEDTSSTDADEQERGKSVGGTPPEMSPALVRSVQTELKRLDYSVKIDGIYGPNTKKAIMAFQSAHGLTADGAVTRALETALKATPTPGTTATSEQPNPPLIKTDDAPAPPETEKEVKTAVTEPYVEKDEATLIAILSTVGQLAYVNCQQEAVQIYYSCGCFGEKTDEMAPDVQKQWLADIDANQKSLNNSIDKIKATSQYTDEMKKERLKNYEERLEQNRQKYAYIQNRDGWDSKTQGDLVTKVQFELTRTHACRRPDGIRETEFTFCMGGNNPAYEKDNENYCRCVSDAAATLWMKPDSPTGSQALNWVRGQAWGQCTP